MNLSSLYTILNYAIDRERRDIVRWLVEEKGADVNMPSKNESPLQRAIFRNNEPIIKDLLAYGANVDFRVPNMHINMPMYCIIRDQPRLLDILLETGASMSYSIKGKPVDPDFTRKNPLITQVHAKHQRWRRLRKWLKLDEAVGPGISAVQKKTSEQC